MPSILEYLADLNQWLGDVIALLHLSLGPAAEHASSLAGLPFAPTCPCGQPRHLLLGTVPKALIHPNYWPRLSCRAESRPAAHVANPDGTILFTLCLRSSSAIFGSGHRLSRWRDTYADHQSHFDRRFRENQA